MNYFGDHDDDQLRPQGAVPTPLAGLLGELVARRGWQQRLEGARVHGRWAEIAGEQLARQTEPVRLVGGVLVLRASSAAWAAQVGYLTAELAERANAVLGEGQVRRISVVTGALQATSDAILAPGASPVRGPDGDNPPRTGP